MWPNYPKFLASIQALLWPLGDITHYPKKLPICHLSKIRWLHRSSLGHSSYMFINTILLHPRLCIVTSASGAQDRDWGVWVGNGFSEEFVSVGIPYILKILLKHIAKGEFSQKRTVIAHHYGATRQDVSPHHNIQNTQVVNKIY